jgi:NodT family efflux transporter outer membrane factor (OMF) lipoprotein
MRVHTRALGALLIAGTISLAGCATVKVTNPQPRIAPPAQWSAAGGAKAADEAALAAWWKRFGDPTLTKLVERAVAGNLDLQTAASRIREARASLASTRAGTRPSASGSASTTVSGTGANDGDISRRYSAGFDASWEIDLFNRLKASVWQAEATAKAREADLQNVLVTLVADVATSYVDVRSLQQRLAIAEANAKAQQESYDLTGFRAKAGLTTELDVEQARTNLESTRASIVALQSQLAQSKHALAVLLGEVPSALNAELEEARPVPEPPLDLAIGLPADALRRRPDVRSAELAVIAQTAQLKATAAQLRPTFRLAGSIGLEAMKLAKLFVPGASSFNLTPSVSYPVFDRRQLRENVVVQTERQAQAATSYEGTVLAALQEVENNLVALDKEQARREHLALAAEAARRSAEMSLQMYTAGLSDFRDVLDSQRSLLSLQDSLASSQAQVVTDLIRLYKALGGGWTPGVPAGPLP